MKNTKKTEKTIHFGSHGRVTYTQISDVHDGEVLDTSVDLAGVAFVIAGENKEKFHQALAKLIEDFYI